MGGTHSQMIFLVAPKWDAWQFGDYLESFGKGLAGRVRVLIWDEIVSRQELPLGSYIFVALDQLTPTEKEIATQCWEKLHAADPHITLLNDPSKVLLRYEFLKACFDEGRNRFQVYRAARFLSCKCFPAFVRGELDHEGSLGGLLRGPGELARAVARKALAGYRLRDLIVVEYCDTVDRAGIFRKYSAFIVGDTIIPHTVMHSRDWITKSHGRLIDAETAREEIEYVKTNPHAEWLRETFDLANIRYGRVDYGLQDGVPQVWEINTNPMIIRHPSADVLTEEQISLREPIRENFFPKFQAAFESIDSTADPSQMVRIEVSKRQLRKLAAEKSQRQRLQARQMAISRVAGFVTRPLRRASKAST